MSRPRGRVALYSHQGFVLRRVARAEASSLLTDIASGFEEIAGRIVKTDYQKAREESPTCLTVTDMKMIAGEYGDAKPIEERRDGYLDPVESAFDKYHAWAQVNAQEIGEYVHAYCVWPRDAGERVQFSTDKREMMERVEISPEVRDYWALRIGSGSIKFSGETRHYAPVCGPEQVEANVQDNSEKSEPQAITKNKKAARKPVAKKTGVCRRKTTRQVKEASCARRRILSADGREGEE